MDLQQYIRSIHDYPKPGIVFRDITTLLENPQALHNAADRLVRNYEGKGISKVVVVESRGFLLGGLLAYQLGAGLTIIRKKGKLPYKTYSVQYDLEYGTDTIEVHQDSIVSGETVLLHDDLLATGGTISAAADLVNQSGGVIVGASFLVELDFLGGRLVLQQAGIQDIFSVIHYESE